MRISICQFTTVDIITTVFSSFVLVEEFLLVYAVLTPYYWNGIYGRQSNESFYLHDSKHLSVNHNIVCFV